ncbi:MAG: type II secretion system protein [Hydrogenoanaerobacterium sp.]
MKKNKKNGGYTLVEVIVSVALFVIGAAMLASSILAAGSMFRTGTNIKSYVSGRRLLPRARTAMAFQEKLLTAVHLL